MRETTTKLLTSTGKCVKATNSSLKLKSNDKKKTKTSKTQNNLKSYRIAITFFELVHSKTHSG